MIFKVDSLTDNTVKLKFVSIVMGIVDVILGACGSCGYANDLFFLVTIIVCFCLSFLLLLCTFLDMFKSNCTSKGMDFVYHLLASFLILLASIVLLTSTSPTTCGVMEKTSSATLAIINSCLYLYISWVVLQHLRDKGDKESFLPLYLLCIFSRNPVVLPVKERPMSPEMPQSPMPSYHLQQQQHYSQSQTQIVQVKSKTPSPIPPQPPVET